MPGHKRWHKHLCLGIRDDTTLLHGCKYSPGHKKWHKYSHLGTRDGKSVCTQAQVLMPRCKR